MKQRGYLWAVFMFVMFGFVQCKQEPEPKEENGKVIIYQVLPRLFGNTNETNIPWGTVEENGVGKFSDFTEEALEAIRELGVTHIWYTGVPHHCVLTDYTAYGIANDDPDVVKGRAGSPYAVKDYYNVNPDLADNPANRLEEFEALIDRTHASGMKVIIDIVPNHVARNYASISKPEGVKDFGEEDNTELTYARNNNFYYITNQAFEVPDFEDGFYPLNGEDHPLRDGQFDENPAKWTGNGSRNAKPYVHDWYETVKVNFGLRPDHSKDFAELPEGFTSKNCQEHYDFWKMQGVPDSWLKFEQIVHYWLDKGVDGFRYDMAQMVPVEFWSFLNSSIKIRKPEAILVSEIYVPEIYRDYILLGKMDFLYDKVELYDTLKNIIQGHGLTDNLSEILSGQADIEHHMLRFLENHDEHRIPAPEFAGDAKKALPGMVLSATIGTAPIMLYFGQELGEKGEGDAGYGKAGRTSIFDYWGVPSVQRWINEGAFDGGRLYKDELELREYYKRLLNLSKTIPAFMGEYAELHSHNRENPAYGDKDFCYLRWTTESRVLVVCNFSPDEPKQYSLSIPSELTQAIHLKNGDHTMTNQLADHKKFLLSVTDEGAEVDISIGPLESYILVF